MTAAGSLLVVAAEYVNASRRLVEHPRDISTATLFFFARRNLLALSKRQLGGNAELVVARIVREAAGPNKWCAQAERVFRDRWAKLLRRR